MVDMTTFNFWFDVMGDVTQDSHTKKFSVNGHVALRSYPIPTQEGHRMLPCEFDIVTGEFSIAERGLTHLAGSPREVGKFLAGFNPIKNLEGGPEVVHRTYSLRGCEKLSSLVGLASTITGLFICPYSYELPMLRALVAPTIHLELDMGGWEQVSHKREVETILNKYTGQGKSGALNCALELKDAGYVENARW